MTNHTPTPYFPDNLDDYAPWVTKYGLYAPYGYCQCGCGQKVDIMWRSNCHVGHLRGHPCRYVRKHYGVGRSHTIPEPPDPESRLIPLTQGKFAIVDAADFEWLSQWTWFAHAGGNTFYANRTVVLRDGKRTQAKMHRVIMGVTDGVFIDHINMNGLDNRRSNLRVATRTENIRNRKAFANNSSGYKGVSWHKRSEKWYAQIQVDGKNVYLGSFDSAEDAARAYDEEARNLHGEFARLNFTCGES